MLPFSGNLSALASLQVIALAILVVKLLITRLARRYPFFTSYLSFELLRSLATAWIRQGSTLYGYFYMFTQPVVWLLLALVVLEVFQVVLSRHPGIATLSRKVVSGAILLSVAVSLLTLLFLHRLDTARGVLESYLLLERVINSSLLGFVLVLAGFLAYFPVPLTRNALVHASVFGFYFVCKTSLWTARTLLGPEFTRTMNVIVMSFVVVALGAWILLLSTAGETQPARSGGRRNQVDEQRLLAQLESINRTLVESGKK